MFAAQKHNKQTTKNSPVHGTVSVAAWLVDLVGNATALVQRVPAAATNVPAVAVR